MMKQEDTAHTFTAAEECVAREDLAFSYRELARLDLNEGVCNHLTVAMPGNSAFLVISHGVSWLRCTPGDLVLVDSVGNVLPSLCGSGNDATEAEAAAFNNGRPEKTAVCIHAAVHCRLGYERAACVFHTHMPAATALTCLTPERGGRILPIHQNACRFLSVTSYDDRFNGLGDSDTEGERIASCIDYSSDKRVLFMANHGVLVVGGSCAECFDDLYFLERTCQNQVAAMSACGGDLSALRLIDADVAHSTFLQLEEDRVMYARRHFESLRL